MSKKKPDAYQIEDRNERGFRFRVALLDVIVICLIFLIMIGGGTFFAIWEGYYMRDNLVKVTTSPKSYEESTKMTENPYTGWYQIYGVTLKDSYDGESADVHETDGQLVLLEINLSKYSDSELSETALLQLSDYLDAWIESGKTIILRPLYDFDGKASKTEPKDINTILRHMEQLAPVVNDRKDSIYIIQGLFIGDYGEMHGSRYTSLDELNTLYEKLSEVIDSDIFLAVRTQWQWRNAAGSFEPLSKQQWESGAGISRLGLFNDGIMGNAEDYGTYGDESLSEASDFSAKGTREEELSFQNAIAEYVPCGGEVIVDNELNDLGNAVNTLKTMRISYLNNQHDMDVLGKWKNTNVGGDDIYKGVNGYDYIGAHLGARPVMRDYVMPGIDKDGYCKSELTIENVGFTRLYRKTEARFRIVGYGTDLTTVAETDPRTWDSGDCVTLPFDIDIRSLPYGSYNIYFDLVDTLSEKSIPLANETEYTEYGIFLGTLENVNELEQWLEKNKLELPKVPWIEEFAKKHKAPEVSLPEHLFLPDFVRNYWENLCDKCEEKY